MYHSINIDLLLEQLEIFEDMIFLYKKVKLDTLYGIGANTDNLKLNKMVNDINNQAKDFRDMFIEFQEHRKDTEGSYVRDINTIKNRFNEDIRQYFLFQKECALASQNLDYQYKQATFSDNQLLTFTNKLDTANDVLRMIQERHKNITQLENSIQEVHELFLINYALLEEQGETLDSAQRRIENAKYHVDYAKMELVEAQKINKRKAVCQIV